MSEVAESRTGLRRRELLGGAALLGAAGAIGLKRVLPRDHGPRIVVFDSGREASRAFAKTGGAVQRIDLADEARTNWRAVRAIERGLPVAGYTGWSGYVAARGWLEERGLRLVSETVDRQRGLIAWTMA